MKTVTWNYEYDGLNIHARRSMSLLTLKELYVITINGEVVTEKPLSSIREMTRIAVAYQGADLEFRFSGTYRALKLCLQVFRNGQQICGDNSPMFFDCDKENRKIEKGLFKFLIKHGVLKLGVPFALIMTVINWPKSADVMDQGIAFIIMMITFGLPLGVLEWWYKKNSLKVYR